MARLQKLGKILKKSLIGVGILGALGGPGTWIVYNQYVAKPEVYMEHNLTETQKETVSIEKKVFYTTDIGHQKAILGMGGLWERIQGPGLNYRLPFETVYDVDVAKVRTIERGFRTKSLGVVTEYERKERPEESLMVTRDEGEIDVKYSIQFKIKNPTDFLFNVRNPYQTLSDVAESSLRNIIASKDNNEALTTGKKQIQKEATELAQSILDDYGTGIRIIEIFLQQTNPPTKEVQAAFDELNNAIQTKETLIQEGKKEYNQFVEEAKGTKKKDIERATGSATQMVNEAEGRVAKFNDMFESFKYNPEMNKFRKWQETMREVIKNNPDMKIIDPETGDGLLKHIFMGKDELGGVK